MRKQQMLNAEIDPDTPVSDVQFPQKETAELSFITSALLPPRRIRIKESFSRDWKNRQMFILIGLVS